MRGRGRAGAGGKLASTQIITCVHTCAVAEQRRSGSKNHSAKMGPTPNLPRPLRNRALQTIIVLKKWQIRPRPLRVCVNIPTVAEQEYQNLPASAPLRACVNVASLICMNMLANTVHMWYSLRWCHVTGILQVCLINLKSLLTHYVNDLIWKWLCP